MNDTIQISKNKIIYELSRFLGEDDPGKIESFVQKKLEQISELLNAQRGIIFLNNSRHKTFSAIWEWCETGTIAASARLQKVSQKDYKIVSKFSLQKSLVMITDTEKIPDSYPLDSKLFRMLKCHSFLQIGFVHQNRFVGSACFMYESNINSPDEDTIEFLKIVGELIKALIIKSSYYHRMNKAAVFEDMSQIFGKKFSLKADNSSFLFDRILGDLHFGISVFDVSAQLFVYANPVFKEMFASLSDNNLSPKTVFSVFSKNGYDIKDFFSEASGRFVKDFTLSYQDHYYTGNISPVKDSSWLVVSVSDITPIANYEKSEKHLNKQLKIISEAAIALIVPGQDKEDVFRFIGKTASRLVDNAIVILNRYKPHEEYLQTVYIEGLGYYVDTVARMIGKHPLKKKYPLLKGSKAYREMMSLKTKELTSLADLSLGAIPIPVASKLQKVLNAERFFSCAIFSEQKLFGTIAFITRPGASLNLYVLETFAHMVSNALDALDSGEKLLKTSDVLSQAASLARIGYWEFDFNTSELILTDRLFSKIEHRYAQSGEEEQVRLPIDVFLQRYVKEDTANKIRKVVSLAKKNQYLENFVSEAEFMMHNSQGKCIHVYCRGVNQKNQRMMGVIQDVSELKIAEKNLWESEIKFQNLVDQSMDAIVVVKEDGVITEWNPRAEQISGMPAVDVIGKYAWEVESALIFNPEIVKKHPQQAEAKLKRRFFTFFNSAFSRKPFYTEVSIKQKNGGVKHLSLTSFVFTANQSKFLCRISRDVTREKHRKEKEKQQEISQKAAKAKDLFLDNMSHELRTPLSGIIGMTDILMHTSLTAQQNEMLGVVKESSDSLLELITNIHELSRLESEGIIIYNKPFPMAVLLEKINSIFKAVAVQRSIQLEFSDQTPDDKRFIGDEFRIRQVLGNLVGNAIKFTPPGGKVEVVAQAMVKAGEKAELEILVKDTGIGIDKDKIPELFNKFTQADSSYTREYDGVGIGLSIGRELVKLMGGEIQVQSEPRQGSVFKVFLTLPFEDAPH